MLITDLEENDIIKFSDNIFTVQYIEENTGCLGGYLIYCEDLLIPLLIFDEDFGTGYFKIIELGDRC